MKTAEKIEIGENVYEGNLKQISFNVILSAENYNEIFDLIRRSNCPVYLTENKSDNGVCNEENIERKATELLKKFFIPAHTKGYRYLREAVILAAKDPELIEKVTRYIYPEIARVHNTTAVRVERVIRHAIEISCQIGDMNFISSYFPLCTVGNKLKPTNAEFIAVLSDELRIGMKDGLWP